MTPLAIVALAAFIAQDPLTEARELVEEGRSLEALQKLEAASRAHPDDAAIHHALGALFATAGRADEALIHIEKAFTLAPDDPAFAFAYGELLYRSGRVEDALEPLKAAAELPEAVFLLAAVYEKLGQDEAMFATLEHYLELRPDDRDARLLLGGRLEAKKLYDRALEVYASDEDDPALLFRAADILGRNRETYAEAEKRVRKSLALAPDLVEASLLLARLLGRTGRHEEALTELERAREASPENPQVYYNLATAYRRAGRLEEAERAAETFQALSKKAKETKDRKARVAVTYKKAADLLAQGRMLEAESVFASVLEIDPEHAQTRAMLAKIAFSKGRLDEALRWVTEALEKDDGVAELHYLKALFLTRGGKGSQAVASLERALALDAAFPDAWSLMGSILLDGGEPDRAVTCFLRAEALEPDNPTIQLNLASAYAELGNEEAEARAMERYRSLSKTR